MFENYYSSSPGSKNISDLVPLRAVSCPLQMFWLGSNKEKKLEEREF